MNILIRILLRLLRKRRKSKEWLRFDRSLLASGYTKTSSGYVSSKVIVPVTAAVVAAGVFIVSHKTSETELKVEPLEKVPERKPQQGVPEDISEYARQQGLRTSLKVSKDTLERFEQHKEMIVSTFNAQGVDLNVANIVIIETRVRPELTSKVGAKGAWQFIDATAKRFGLKTEADVRDINKSTKAAAQYLRWLHDFLGCWDFAVMAYNCGEGNLQKAIRAAGYDVKNKNWTQEQIWNVWKHVPKETKSYYLQWLDVSRQNDLSNIVVKNKDIVMQGSSVTASPHNRKEK